jgi:hypothetical protein
MKMLVNLTSASDSDDKVKTKRPKKQVNHMLLENYMDVNKMARQYLRSQFKLKAVPDTVAAVSFILHPWVPLTTT